MRELTEALDTDAIRTRAKAATTNPWIYRDLVNVADRDVPDLLAEIERLRAGIAHIVDRYGNAPGIETCATMYDLRRLAYRPEWRP